MAYMQMDIIHYSQKILDTTFACVFYSSFRERSHGLARGGQLSRPTEASSNVFASISSSDLCVESDGIHADEFHPAFSETIRHMKFSCILLLVFPREVALARVRARGGQLSRPTH